MSHCNNAGLYKSRWWNGEVADKEDRGVHIREFATDIIPGQVSFRIQLCTVTFPLLFICFWGWLPIVVIPSNDARNRLPGRDVATVMVGIGGMQEVQSAPYLELNGATICIDSKTRPRIMEARWPESCCV